MKFLRETKALAPTRTKEHRQTHAVATRQLRGDIYKQVRMTPHEEMERVMDAADVNTIIEAAAQTATNFILGDEVVFKSDDIRSRKLVAEYWKSLRGDLVMEDAVSHAVKTGNGYLEADYDPVAYERKGLLVPSNLYVVPDPSQMYINCDAYGNPTQKKMLNQHGQEVLVDNNDEYYIQKLEPSARVDNASYYNISYYKAGILAGGQYGLRIFGKPIHRDKLIHFKLGTGKIGLYGRSQFASSLNDNEMLYEMERSIAVLAKYKAVPRKIWSMGSKDMPATADEVDDFMMYLESLDKEEDVWTNKPVQATDVSYSGGEINLDYAINHVKRKLIAGVALDFLSGMGQDVNRATASQELIAFILSIYAKRKGFLYEIQRRIIDPFVKYYGLKPVEVDFAELDFETRSEREARVRQNWTSNMVTLNEMREDMGLPTVDPDTPREHIGDKFFSEVQMEQQAASFGGMGDMFGGEDETPALPAPEAEQPKPTMPSIGESIATKEFFEALRTAEPPTNYTIDE